jgi:hypothetical protein
MATAKKAEAPAKSEPVEEQGFSGDRVDHTPRENYTLQTPQDAPTPETTERNKQAEEANAAKIAARLQ